MGGLTSRHGDVEFFWDPICPFAWITSRWMVDVAEQRRLVVRWRAISLSMVNEDDYDDEVLSAKKEGHALGLGLLRVAAAIEAGHGNEAVGRFYTAVGTALHVDGDRERIMAGGAKGVAEDGLATCGLPGDLAAAAGDEALDAAVRKDTETALERAGRDLGTPIITFGPPDGPSFFGPVISRIPRGAEAVQLWDAVETVARHPSFAELKRSLREPPQTAG